MEERMPVSASRLERLMERQRAAGLDCIALVPGPNLRYVSGLTLFMSERPIVAFFPLDRRPAILLPAFEQGRAAKTLQGHDVDFVTYTDEEGYQGAFKRAVESLALDGKQIAVEHRHMRVLELRAMEAAAPNAHLVSLEQVLPGLRIAKDQSEIEIIRHAIAITEKALHALLSQPLIGLSERQIASRLEHEIKEAGGEGVAFIIVVAGPNSADPHAGPSDRPVQAGEFLTIDFGATYDGYLADITRTFALGNVGEDLKEIYEAVRRANAAGRATVKPGVAAQDVDRAAREVIEQAGYGAYFTHRTGHGLGIEGHEPPYIVKGNVQPLEAGMVFTIEPGIYIPGLGGVRIEDDVIVTGHGLECLTTFARELTIIQ
jgi:Xaa-Pro dipeptidase